MAKKKAVKRPAKKVAAPKTETANETNSSPSLEIVEETVQETVGTVTEIIAAQSTKIKGGQLWWKTKMFHADKGYFEGVVTDEMAAWFVKATPKETLLENWVLDYDPVQRRKDEAKKKAKAKTS
jgi:hypothetical protein